MATTIKTITDKTGPQNVTKATVNLVTSTDGTSISVEGTVGNANPIFVTCTVSRHHKGTGVDQMAWTRTLFCQATGGNWTADIGKLALGKYTFVFAAEGEDIDCVKLEVTGPKAKLKPTAHAEIAIISTGESTMAINVKGSVNNYPQTVSCSLTPITNTGASRGPTSSKAVRCTTGTWIVAFYPIDVEETSFNGLYSFTAWAYEGSASEPILVT